MFETLILILGIVCIGILVYGHSKGGDLPPKAKLICDVWTLVEKNPQKPIEKRAAGYTCMSSTI